MMLTRILLRLLLLAGLVMPLSGFGLGVGPLQVRSALYQNLEAEIPLTVSNPAELVGLKVQIPRQQVFDQMGVERQAFFANLRFAVHSAPGGGVIKVTSTQPIRDPNFDLLLEAVWPRGRLLRTFPVQIDPALYAERQQPPPPIIEPQTPAPTDAAEPTPAPTELNPPAAPEVSFEGATTYGPVRRGENLTQIARQVRPSEAISIPRMKAILVAGNPEAFSRGNPNTLRLGATLRVPTATALGVEATAPAAPAPDTAAALTPPQPADLAPPEAPLAPPPAPATPLTEAPPPTPIPAEPVAEAPATIAPLTESAAAPTPVTPLEPPAPPPIEAPSTATPSAALPPATETPAPLPAPQEILPPATQPQPAPEPSPSAAPPVAETPPAPATPEPAAEAALPVAQTPPPAVTVPPAEDASWLANPLVWIAIALIVLAVGAAVLLPILRSPKRRAATTDADAPIAELEASTADEAEAPPDDLVRTRIEMLRNRRSQRSTADAAEEDAAAAPTLAAAPTPTPAKPAPKAAPPAAPPKPIDELLKNIDFNLSAASEISIPKLGGTEQRRMPDAEPPTASVTKAKVATPPPKPSAPAALPVVEPKTPATLEPLSELGGGLQFDKMDFDLSELGLDAPRKPNELPPLELTPVTSAPPAHKTNDDLGALDFDLPAFEPAAPASKSAFTLDLPSRQTPPAHPEPTPAADLKFEFADVSQDHQGHEGMALLDADLQNFGGGLGVDEATLDLAAPSSAAGAGTDYLETKLDLAAAYLDMGDQVGARGLLEDVASEGDANQKKRAADLLKKLS